MLFYRCCQTSVRSKEWQLGELLKFIDTSISLADFDLQQLKPHFTKQ